MAEIFLAPVVTRVVNLAVDSLVQEACFVRGVPEQVRLMNAELMQLEAFLKDADAKWREGNASVKNWVRALRDAASEAENVLEDVRYITQRNYVFSGALSRYARKPCHLIKLHHLGVKIEQINRRLKNIFDDTSKYGINKMSDESPEHTNRRQVSSGSEDNVKVIGFDDYKKQIVEQLVNQENKLLTVVSIFGMGGIGKSTLANKVYNDPQVKEYFEVFVWVAVSQKYEAHHLLKEIKKQIMRNEEDREMNEEKTRKTLREFLRGKKYLIVLDDVWETTAWDQLQGQGRNRVFPEAKRGSRILLTTRKLEVAEYPDQKREIHELKRLDEIKSWELLHSKAFPSYRDVTDSTKNELKELGGKLAEKCEGLPLALVILGDYLSRCDCHEWRKLVASVDWKVTDKIKKMEKVFALSYRDLSEHDLKACFLYISSFPEGFTIPASTLIELWIAEGFVPHKQGHQLEETARRIMEELARRCMVQVAERSIAHGWIDSIRIHDVLRDWAISEGIIDGFVNVCRSNQDVNASSSDAMPAYRVSLMNNVLQVQFSAATQNLRTLLAFKLSPNLVSQIGRLRFLRVLLLEGIEQIKFPKGIDGMIHLRYLGIRHCLYVELPSSMWCHLLYLQTLDARGTMIGRLPSSFWKITTLRNVYLEGVAFAISPKSNCQRSLQTLYISDEVIYNKYKRSNRTALIRGGFLSSKFDVEATIRSLVGNAALVSLTLRCLRFGPIPLEVLSGFKDLHQLTLDGPLKKLPGVSLKLSDDSLPLQKLRELELARSQLEEDPMPILEKLPELVLLQLISDAYKGSSMRCSSDGFLNLQRLKLGNLMSVREWAVEEGAMPKLTHLEIDTLPNLKMVPEEGLQHLRSLKQLTLRDSLSTGNFEELEKGCAVIIRE